MAYCTAADILDQVDQAKLIQLTDDAGEGSVDSDKVDKAIADADEEINGYVGTRYSVPLDPVPGIIRKQAVDIAIYNLYGRRDAIPENRAKRYDNAIKFLQQIALGKISLGANDPDGNPPASDAPQLSTDNPERLFTRSSMDGF